jgi:hypothetical protein
VEDTLPIDPWFVLLGVGAIALLLVLFFFFSRGGTAKPPKNGPRAQRHADGTPGDGGDGPARC